MVYRETVLRALWQGKYFSVLGDSISTLEGCQPPGFSLFYTGQNILSSGVARVEDTWWGRIIGACGGRLLVNNSWSGCRVAKVPGSTAVFPSACSEERTGTLHAGELRPDVVMIYLGVNDWAKGTPLQLQTGDDTESFFGAYGEMLRRIRINYPETEVWCCTLCGTFISSNPDFRFPSVLNGRNLEDYNGCIREQAECHGCTLIDLSRLMVPYDSLDGVHPVKAGMETLAELIMESICRLHPVTRLEHPGIGEPLDVVDGIVCRKPRSITGTSLRELVEVQGPQPPEQVVSWAAQVCGVLAYLHDRGWLYQLIHPCQLLLQPDGRIVLGDFGCLIPFVCGRKGNFMGYPGYAAPELYGGGNAGPWSDIYSLGVTLFYLLTGTEPQGSPNALRSVDPELPGGLEYIISKCMELSPEDRYVDCKALLHDLSRYQKLPPSRNFFRRLFHC